MIDNSLIKSGFDVEALIGENFILSVLQAAYAAQEIPNSLSAMNSPNVLKVKSPTKATLIFDPNKNADLEVTIPLHFDYSPTVGYDFDAIIGLSYSLTDNANESGISTGCNLMLSFQYLDPATIAKIQVITLALNNPQYQLDDKCVPVNATSDQKKGDLLTYILCQLKIGVSRSIQFELLGTPVVEVQTRKLPSNGVYSAAIGIYANLNISISPQSDSSETHYLGRGDINNAVSFLPPNRFYAAGVSSTSMDRIANGIFHYIKSTVDQLQSVSLNPSIASDNAPNGSVMLDIKAEEDGVTLDLQIQIIPSITDQGQLSITFGIINIDVSTSIWDKVIIGLGLVLTGGIGAVALGVGAIIIGGLEGDGEDYIRTQGNKALGDFLNAIPATYPLFTHIDDLNAAPLVEDVYYLVNTFEELKTDSYGISITGNTSFVEKTVNVDRRMNLSMSPSKIPANTPVTVTVSAIDSLSNEAVTASISIHDKSPHVSFTTGVPFIHTFVPYQRITHAPNVGGHLSSNPHIPGNNGNDPTGDGSDPVITYVPILLSVSKSGYNPASLIVKLESDSPPVDQ